MTNVVDFIVNEMTKEHNEMIGEMTAQHNAMLNMTLVKTIEIQQYLLILIFVNFSMIVMLAIAYYPYEKTETQPEGYKPLSGF